MENSLVFEYFGEAVYELMDKNTKSKMKKKKKKVKPDYKKLQIIKWQKKVEKIQFAVDWLSERCYWDYNICLKEKPIEIKLEIFWDPNLQ